MGGQIERGEVAVLEVGLHQVVELETLGFDQVAAVERGRRLEVDVLRVTFQIDHSVAVGELEAQRVVIADLTGRVVEDVKVGRDEVDTFRFTRTRGSDR